jgi:hypothetical protein
MLNLTRGGFEPVSRAACGRLGVLCLLAALGAACTGGEAPAPTAVARAAIGEPTDGFPNWSERAVLVLTNRARCDPAADLADCGATCAERACYSPVQPLVWNHGLGRSARFHSDNLERAGCVIQHDSPCDLVGDIATQYTPGPCNGDPGCACEAGSLRCGSVGTPWNARIIAFAGSTSGENIAQAWDDPEFIFYMWLYEPDGSATCGFRMSNGHRYNILSGDNRAIGIGRSGGGSIFTQDFDASGSPDGIVSGVHYPRTGDTLAFRANWYRASGPEAARVNVDGTCHEMALERGSVTNGTYLASVGGLGAGCHQYYFHFTDGGAEIYYPTTGAYGIGCSYDWDATRPDPCEGCEPDCAGRTCGPNGCGGICGTCAGETTCNGSGVCACAGGLTNCSGLCRDINTDTANCGGCGVTCAAGEVCSAGDCQCVPACAGRVCGDDGCGGVCGTCTGGTTCDGAGQCLCPAGLQDCSGVCVDLTADRANCGTCGRACATGEGCQAGECTEDCAPTCAGRECGDDGCGGSCGDCDEGLVCDAAGVCGCGPDALDCGAGCVDTSIDRENCGGCGVICAATEACVGGECRCQPACAGRECGDDGCGGSCGACGDDRSCVGGGQCLCLGALTECGEVCVDVRTDDANCGGCDAPCTPPEGCVAGECTTDVPDGGCEPACAGRSCGDDACGGSCGECGPEQTCASGGQCLCPGELTGCGPECVDVRTSAAHCGTCNHTCPAGEQCVGGECSGEGDAGAVDVPPLRLMFGGTACDCRAAAPAPARGTAGAAILAVCGVLVFRRRR